MPDIRKNSVIYTTAPSSADIKKMIDEALQEFKTTLYAVGDVYLTYSSTEIPSQKFGGTWELSSKGRVLIGVDTATAPFNESGLQGGAFSRELVITNIPSHTHTIPILSGSASTIADHTHTGPSHTHTSAAHTHTGPAHAHTSAAHVHALAGSGAAAASNGNHIHTIASNIYIDAPSFSSPTYFSGNLSNGFWLQRISDTANAGNLTENQTSTAGAHPHSLTGSSASTTPGNTGAAGTGPTGSTTPGNTGAAGTENTGADGGHNHTISTVANTTGAAGSTTPADVDITPKYETVYVWKKIA